MTGYQPGFYRCGGRRQREQQINRASTGVMTEFFDGGSNRASTGVGRGCGEIWVGFSGHRFSTRLAEIININKRRYTNELVNRVSTGMTAKMRGLRSRLDWSLFIDPPAAPPM